VLFIQVFTQFFITHNSVSTDMLEQMDVMRLRGSSERTKIVCDSYCERTP
jgi:hypothetical protein